MDLKRETILPTLQRGIAVALLAVSVGVYAPVAVAGARDECDVGTLEGGYGLVGNGFLLLGGDTIPTAAIGNVEFDGNGNVSALITQSVTGTLVRIPVTGTYTVNSDCTGSLVTTDNDGITRTFDMVIVAGGQEVLTLPTGPGLVSAFSIKQK